MEYAPLRRKGKGGEAPSFTARFLFLGGEAEIAFSLLLRSMIHHGDEPVVPLWSRWSH